MRKARLLGLEGSLSVAGKPSASRLVLNWYFPEIRRDCSIEVILSLAICVLPMAAAVLTKNGDDFWNEARAEKSLTDLSRICHGKWGLSASVAVHPGLQGKTGAFNLDLNMSTLILNMSS